MYYEFLVKEIGKNLWDVYKGNKRIGLINYDKHGYLVVQYGQETIFDEKMDFSEFCFTLACSLIYTRLNVKNLYLRG